MIAYVKDDYTYVNYNAHHRLNSYIEFVQWGCKKVSPEVLLKFPKHTYLFNDEYAGSFGAEAAGISSTADGDTGFFYIDQQYAAVCYGLDALSYAVNLLGGTVSIKHGFALIVSPSFSGDVRYGNYGLEALSRTGHRVGLVSRLVGENPTGSLSLANGAMIYSFDGIKQPASMRADEYAWVGRKLLMLAGEEIHVKNYSIPFKNSADELYTAQLGAILAKSSGVSIQDFSGRIRIEPGQVEEVQARIDEMREFVNNFNRDMFNTINDIESSVYTQECELMSAVSPRDLSGDNASLFRSGLLLESSLMNVLKLFDANTIKSFDSKEIFDLVTVKNEFAGMLGQYKYLKEKLRKDSLIGTITQLSICADYVCDYVTNGINSRVSQSAYDGEIRQMVVNFNKTFIEAHNGWSQNSPEVVSINIPENFKISVIDRSGVFHPTIPEEATSNELNVHIQAMAVLLNPKITEDSQWDYHFSPRYSGGMLLQQDSNGSLLYCKGILLEPTDTDGVYQFSSYLCPNLVRVNRGEEVEIDGSSIQLLNDESAIIINGSKRTLFRGVKVDDVVDLQNGPRALDHVYHQFVKETITRDLTVIEGEHSLCELNSPDRINQINDILASTTPTYRWFPLSCGWLYCHFTKHSGRGNYDARRMRYLGCKLIASNEGKWMFEHYIEHQLTGWYTNGCTSASATASQDRAAIRAALPDAIVSESSISDLWAGHGTLAAVFGTVGGVIATAGIIALACGAIPVGGWVVAAVAAAITAIASIAVAIWALFNKYTDVDTSSIVSAIRYPGHCYASEIDITQAMGFLGEGTLPDYSKVTSAISSMAADLAFTKIEPMLKTLRKSSMREMLVLANKAESPTAIFDVETANSFFAVNATEVQLFIDALNSLIEADDEYRPIFETFVASLQKLLDGEATTKKAFFLTEEAIRGAPVTPNPGAFDIGYQITQEEF